MMSWIVTTARQGTTAGNTYAIQIAGVKTKDGNDHPIKYIVAFY